MNTTQGDTQVSFIVSSKIAIVHKRTSTNGDNLAKNKNLASAKKAKNDEFYTRYEDIEAEMNAYVEYNPNVFRDKNILLPCDDPDRSNFTRYFTDNFTRFGLKQLVSTSLVTGGRGKLLTLTRDMGGRGIHGLLHGDGDFRSPEVTRLRDQADIIITNPPFSLFHEFLPWITDAGKRFIIMGNKNAFTYREVFPLLHENRIWAGYTPLNGGRWMILPENTQTTSGRTRMDDNGDTILNIPGVCWLTNMNHGRRNKPLQLDTMQHNLEHNERLRHKLLADYGRLEYPCYDNYDAIEIPFVDAIPSDYTGRMGVPVTFLDKYNPSQFTIVGCFYNSQLGRKRQACLVPSHNTTTIIGGVERQWNGPVINHKPLYKRIVIQAR